MSTEGGEGHKPKPWAQTKVKKHQEPKDISSTSEVTDHHGDTKPKASASAAGSNPHDTTEAAAGFTKKLDSTISDSTQESALKETNINLTQAESPPRQVIAVSASKGPAAFFNLARKFLVTDETCDLSALEGAIVSAVDAAHLLERSKLATIIRIQTSYVAVGPKRKKARAPAYSDDLSRETQHKTGNASELERIGGHESTSLTQSIHSMKQSAASTSQISEHEARLISTPMSGLPQGQVRQIPRKPKDSGSGGKELRRARMIITVKRTEDYKKWLLENPLQDVVSGDNDEVGRTSTSASRSHPP